MSNLSDRRELPQRRIERWAAQEVNETENLWTECVLPKMGTIDINMDITWKNWIRQIKQPSDLSNHRT